MCKSSGKIGPRRVKIFFNKERKGKRLGNSVINYKGELGQVVLLCFSFHPVRGQPSAKDCESEISKCGERGFLLCKYISTDLKRDKI